MATRCPRKPASASRADAGMDGDGTMVTVEDVTEPAISNHDNARTRTVTLGKVSV